MATIIDFSAERTARPAPAGSANTTAEIVIFPGVRYERTPPRSTDSPEEPAQSTRDALLIPD